MRADRDRARAAGKEGVATVAEVEGVEGVEEHPRKQIYLRTLYPLNPGIPHYVDVPGGW